MSQDERRLFREAARAEAWEEELADVLTLAIRLPAERVLALEKPERIAQESGLPLAWIRERLEHLNGHRLTLDYVPYWSAAREFSFAYHPAPEGAFLLRDRVGRPHFRFPAGASYELRNRQFRLAADLVALRGREFAVKWRRFAVLPGKLFPYRPRPLPIDMEALWAWSREKGEEHGPVDV